MQYFIQKFNLLLYLTQGGIMATVIDKKLKQELIKHLAKIKKQIERQNGYKFDPEELELLLHYAVEGNFCKGVNFIATDTHKVHLYKGYAGAGMH